MGIYFPPPPVFTGGSQPYSPRELTPPSNPPAADNPQFGQAARLRREFWALRLSWETVPPLSQGGREFIHAAAVAADNPPFRVRDQRSVLAGWQATPWVFEQALLVQGVPVHEPPYSDREPLHALLAWNVGPQRIPAQRFLAQGAAAVVVDDPPFSGRRYWSAVLAWQIPVPRSQGPQKQVQEFVQAVDNPPFSDRDYLHPALALWRTDPLPTQAQQHVVQPGAVAAQEQPPPTRRIVAELLAWQLEIPHFQPQRQLAIGYVPDDPPYTGRKPLSAVPQWVPPWPPVVYLPKQVVDNPLAQTPVAVRLVLTGADRSLDVETGDSRLSFTFEERRLDS